MNLQRFISAYIKYAAKPDIITQKRPKTALFFPVNLR